MSDLESDELVRAAELYEKLLVAGDGGEDFVVGDFEATTLLLMLEDARYRARVIRKHEELYH